MVKDEVKSLTHFFPVSKTWKGEVAEKRVDKIRMIYDATQSGLNDAVWVPWFAKWRRVHLWQIVMRERYF